MQRGSKFRKKYVAFFGKCERKSVAVLMLDKTMHPSMRSEKFGKEFWDGYEPLP